MRTLALDYGSKRIGVAVSDPLGITAQGVAVVERSQVIPELKKIIASYDSEITELLVGMPKTMAGEIGIQGEKVQEFIKLLKDNFDLPVVTWDERLTTSATERVLIDAGLSRKKRKKVIDKQAATYILQSYLDCKK